MADAPTPPAAAEAPKLDDLMLAMDVVDTLRHDQRLVERELSLGYSDEALIERLREIYKGQGIDVPDEVLQEGVKALREKRFAYDPPKPGLARSLAIAWINRGRIGAIAGTILAVAGGAGLLYHFTVTRPQEIAQSEARVEVEQTIPKALDEANAEIVRQAKDDTAKAKAAEYYADGKAALARGDTAAARKAQGDLAALLDQLRSEYTLRVVNRPGEASGVWRNPRINGQARNDYLIVEAVTPDGRTLSLPILNEETGATTNVNKWGVRVNDDTFQRVLADKRDDGIIERNVVGEKKRGYLSVDYVMPVLGGTITKW
jgi:Family of unknown function (DUF6384)